MLRSILPPSEPCERLAPHTAPRSILLRDLPAEIGLGCPSPRRLRLHSRSVSILHLRSLAFVVPTDGAPALRRPPFGAGISHGMMALVPSSPMSPVGPVHSSRCLSAGRLRFLGHRFLLGSCTALAVGLLIYRVCPCLRRSVPMRVSTFPSIEMRLGWVLSLLRGHGVLPRNPSDILVRRPDQPSLLLTAPASRVTEPRREFTFVHPSNLPLARSAREQAFLRLLLPGFGPRRYQQRPQGGGSAWTLAEMLISITRMERLRVARSDLTSGSTARRNVTALVPCIPEGQQWLALCP